jgi:hypothetical protein
MNISMKLCFVSVNGPRETYFTDELHMSDIETIFRNSVMHFFTILLPSTEYMCFIVIPLPDNKAAKRAETLQKAVKEMIIIFSHLGILYLHGVPQMDTFLQHDDNDDSSDA